MESIVIFLLTILAGGFVAHHFYPIVGFDPHSTLHKGKYIMGYDDFSNAESRTYVDGSGWNKRGMIRFWKLFLQRFPRHRKHSVYWVKILETGEVVWSSDE